MTKHTQRKHIRTFQPFVRLKQDDIRHRVENVTNVTKRGQHKRIVIRPVIAINVETSFPISEKQNFTKRTFITLCLMYYIKSI